LSGIFANETALEREEFRLIVDGNVALDKFLEYNFTSDFLIPSDQFSFTVAYNYLTDKEKQALVIGAEVVLEVVGSVQCTGYIDSLDFTGSRDGGTRLTITGRDKLSYAVDSHIDPRVSFKAEQSLLEVLGTVFEPFGFSEDMIDADNDANRSAQTGNLANNTRKGEGARSVGARGRALKKFKIQPYKPYPGEGVFAFASRLSQRFGLWIWMSADGNTLIVSKPNFDTQSVATLQRSLDPKISANNNVLDGTIKFDATNQPSIVYASGSGGGGEFPKSKLRAGIKNPCIDVDTTAIEETYPQVQVEKPNYGFAKFKNKHARPIYLYDDESKTQEQLDYYVQREMSLFTRRSLNASYTVPGHAYRTGGEVCVWTVDTLVNVIDDVADFQEQMWVQSRTFTKSRGGTRTQLQLIRPNTLVF
jgi:prophage tail gpP-like protein